MADKISTVNSLVTKGIVPQDIAADLLNAPPKVNAWLESLDGDPKINAAFVPNRPVAPAVGKTPAAPTADEADMAEAMGLLKAKRAADAKAKGMMVNALKANAKCKFTPEALEKMSADDLKALSESIGQPVTSYAAGAGGTPPSTPRVNSALADASPAMPTAEEMIKTL
jgi:hypothetical protein